MDAEPYDNESFRIGMETGTQMISFEEPVDRVYEQREIPRRAEGGTVRTVILKPLKQETPLPGVFWIHGGAFASGKPEGSMAVMERLQDARDCVIVSPDYRLSLEAAYPAGVEDCYDALVWMKDHAEELGIRHDQIAVGGDSSGAGFAVALCMMARDRGDVWLAFQMPLFPCLDDRMNTESMTGNTAPLVDQSLVAMAWKYYLGDLFETGEVPVYAAPARQTDYTGLPPLISYVGGVDPMRSETAAYVEKLREAGIPVHFRIFDGCFHGFEEFCPDAAVSIEAKKFLTDSFLYALDHYFAGPHKKL